jgi:hypothetical protein
MTLGNMGELGVYHLIGYFTSKTRAAQSAIVPLNSTHGWPMLLASNANAIFRPFIAVK